MGAKRKMSKTLQATDVEEGSVRSDGKNASPVEFKGFKKRKLARKEKMNTEQGKSSSDIDVIQELRKKNHRPRVIKVIKSKKRVATSGKKAVEGDSYENQAASQREYLQCLGLQPTMQVTCHCCGEKGFPSLLALNMHQRGCGITQKSNFIANLPSDMSTPPSDPNLLTDFRTIGKVYHCSACGTYYKNWNLFLHMRDVHKKHICLYCFTMFGLAEQLADHLRTTHNIQESNYKSSEEFQNAYKGSYYLICCACESMFNERDDYFYHQCGRKDPTAKELLMEKEEHCVTSSDILSDYFISDATSFCHVDIGDESGEKDNVITEEEECVSNKAVSEIENEPETSKSAAEPKFVIPQEYPEESKHEDNKILKEYNCNKNILEEGENVGENNVIEKETSNKHNVINNDENLVEGDSHKIRRDDEGEKYVHLEDENSKYPQNTTNFSNDKRTDKSPQEGVTIIDKTENEVTKVSDEESLACQNEKDDSASSDTDVEPSSQLNISQESCKSSSDESSYGETKQSNESKKHDSIFESENSHKSGLVVDEKPRNLTNDIGEDNKTQSDVNILEEQDSSKEVNISLKTETTKDIHLEQIETTNMLMLLASVALSNNGTVRGEAKRRYLIHKPTSD